MIYSASFRSRSRNKILLLTASLIIIGVIAVTASGWLDSSTRSEEMLSKEQPAQASLALRPPTVLSNQLQVERVTITPTGFNPEEITRPAGQVILAIDNRSGLEEIRLRLDREGGQRMVDVRVDRKKLDWRRRIDLPAGRYRLTEGNHPSWLLQITITP
jgi:hypothetical protein